MAIILARRGAPATRLERTVIQDESYLQRYIYENPDVLPLDQLQEDIRPLVLVREFPTPSGPIDALATDADGNLYLIETKLYKNPDKRLVLAQVLDYGAALWKAYPDPDDFVTRLDSLMRESGGKGLLPRVEGSFGLEGQDATDFLGNLKGIIQSGEFRFVVLMDRVDDRLRDLISYVNVNSSFRILGVALDFYKASDFDILIPTLHGGETKKSTGSTASARRTWDSQSFFADASARLPESGLAAVRAVHDAAASNGCELSWGTGAQNGSFNVKDSTLCQRSLLSVYTNGKLCLNFAWLNENDRAKAVRDRFIQLAVERLKLPSADYRDKYLNLQIDEWQGKSSEIVRLLADLLKEFRAA